MKLVRIATARQSALQTLDDLERRRAAANPALPQDGKPMHQIYEEHFEQIGEQRAARLREQL